MKRIFTDIFCYCALVCCLAIVHGCAFSSTGHSNSGTRYQRTVDRMTDTTRGLELPEYLQNESARKQGTEFNVMRYFQVLTHISMTPGRNLDYVYHYDGMGGYPILYAGKMGEPPFRTEKELFGGAHSAPKSTLFMHFVRSDMTEAGFFELILLKRMAGQFYLFWHALYNDVKIICDVDSLNEILEGESGMTDALPPEIRRKAQALKLSPQILITDTLVTVEITTFTKWGGFFRERYTLQKIFPHTILNIERTNLIEYDCGLMF